MNEKTTFWQRLRRKEKPIVETTPAILKAKEPEKRLPQPPIYYEVNVREYVPSTEVAEKFAINLSAVQIEAKVEGQWTGLAPYFASSAIGNLEVRSELVSGWTHIAWGNRLEDSPIRLPGGTYLNYSDTPDASVLRAKISSTGETSATSVLTIVFNVNLKDSFGRNTSLTLDLFTNDSQIKDFIQNTEKNNLFPLQVLAALLPNVKILPKDIKNNYLINAGVIEISCPPITTIAVHDTRHSDN